MYHIGGILYHNKCIFFYYVCIYTCIFACIIVYTRGGPCQHGFMCGCKQWSNDINESNYNMQPITIIQFAVRVGAYVHSKN